MPASPAADRARIPLLARLKVGTKLMLLVLLPVGVLLGFTTVNAVADWRAADQLAAERAATQLSFAAAAAADRLAVERTAAEMLRLRPGAQAGAGLSTAQHGADQALSRARASAAGWHGAVDVAGRLAATGRQLTVLRLQVADAFLPVPDISRSYSVIVGDLINTTGELVEDTPPPQTSDRAADAYLAILRAVEAAQHEQVDVAASLAAPADQAAVDQMIATSRWATLEGAELGMFRRKASGRLVAGLGGVLSSPAGIEVRTSARRSSPARAQRSRTRPWGRGWVPREPGSTACASWSAERPATWPRRPRATFTRRARPACATSGCRSRCWRWSSPSAWWYGGRSPDLSPRSPTGRGPCPAATWTST